MTLGMTVSMPVLGNRESAPTTTTTSASGIASASPAKYFWWSL
ncbi:Uncharacterised protein [Mycobacteroides abscessus subsp. abscessus]|nr:Uncharacterised protein [Mycobacteroides abscessus subsp. abscessus]